ncbi:MAG TPA: rhodanese-like domain-containing protein [Syntrophobacteraceae bacterium]|nr:rhodanese-like domain-containing protein [Syntrophobacteraceae bacterium]
MRNNFITDALWQGLAIILIAVALSLSVNHFRQDGLPLVGKPVPGPSSLETPGSWREAVISIEEARALFLTNGAVFIDARPEEVYRCGHIKGALNLPPDSLEESLPAVMAQIPLDSFIITYCDGEDCPLSKEAALQLAAKGYSNVQVLVNGWSAWQDAGLPAEK